MRVQGTVLWRSAFISEKNGDCYLRGVDMENGGDIVMHIPYGITDTSKIPMMQPVQFDASINGRDRDRNYQMTVERVSFSGASKAA